MTKTLTFTFHHYWGWGLFVRELWLVGGGAFVLIPLYLMIYVFRIQREAQ